MKIYKNLIRVKEKKWWNSLRFKEQQEVGDASWENQSCRWEDRSLLATESGKGRDLESSWTKKEPDKNMLNECSKGVGEDDDWEKASRLSHLWLTFLHVGIFLEMLFYQALPLFLFKICDRQMRDIGANFKNSAFSGIATE